MEAVFEPDGTRILLVHRDACAAARHAIWFKHLTGPPTKHQPEGRSKSSSPSSIQGNERRRMAVRRLATGEVARCDGRFSYLSDGEAESTGFPALSVASTAIVFDVSCT